MMLFFTSSHDCRSTAMSALSNVTTHLYKTVKS